MITRTPKVKREMIDMREVAIHLPPPVPSTHRMNVAKELKGLGAPEFKGEADEGPVATHLWLNDVKIMLDGLHCSEVEKLDGVVSLLRWQARIWWTNVIMRMTSDMVVNRAKALERALNEMFGEHKARTSKKTGTSSSSSPSNRARDFGFQSQARFESVASSSRRSNQMRTRQTQSVGYGIGKFNQSQSRHCQHCGKNHTRSERLLRHPKEEEEGEEKEISLSLPLNRKLKRVTLTSSDGVEGLITNVIDTRAKEKGLENIPIVREFPDVFPAELSRLPPDREFLHDLLELPSPQAIELLYSPELLKLIPALPPNVEYFKDNFHFSLNTCLIERDARFSAEVNNNNESEKSKSPESKKLSTNLEKTLKSESAETESSQPLVSDPTLDKQNIKRNNGENKVKGSTKKSKTAVNESSENTQKLSYVHVRALAPGSIPIPNTP
ncbi:Basic helix-loop-helix DNA-binding superfamily protein, putative isoform 2 [Hibiscus syriacus]|uniref:Basic helix-loop-helix DNA-binding superfamily protein, putative isoform 2 n=1 Tax=Hibiscus syriacus TaxID=106335 RepID=A0A6A2XQZ3_HIBSY|nr:Basic helix-loop-helix DNA-binding superfamily protein, putative isoform 2 [Hibiscus syriacus]